MMKKIVLFLLQGIIAPLFALQAETLIIAHRGAALGTAENSLSAFIKSVQEGSIAIECDIRRCKSGELVLRHDEMIEEQSITNLTLKELRTLNPLFTTLQELFDAMPAGIIFALDLKENGIAPDVASMITHEIEIKGRSIEHFYTTGYHHHEQVALKKLLPAIRLVPAIVGTPYNLADYLHDMDAYGYCIVNRPGGAVSNLLIQDVVAKGFKLWIFQPVEASLETINTIPLAALITDTPQRFKEKSL